jgi:hypothetical protein
MPSRQFEAIEEESKNEDSIYVDLPKIIIKLLEEQF